MKLFSANERNATGNIAVLPKIEFAIERLESASSLFERPGPDRLEVLEIIMVKNGQGHLACDASTIQLQSSSIYVIVPGQVRYLLLGSDVSGYVMRIAADFVRQMDDQFDILFMIQLALSENGVLCVENMANLKHMEFLITKLIGEFERNGLSRIEVMKEFVKLFLIHLSLGLKGIKSPDTYDGNSELLRNFFSLLWQQSSSKKLVADYADELCVTPNYLNAIIRKLTGFTASHHIQQHIVMEAKRHAIYSLLQMKEIASHLGFEDHAHFSKFFKNYSGINFSAFRKSSRQWDSTQSHPIHAW